MGYTSGQKLLFTDIYTFGNAINYTRPDCSDTACPCPEDALSPLYESAAEHIIDQAGTVGGLCLVYGSVPYDYPYTLVLAGEILFAGGTNKVAAYNITNGDELWRRALNGRARALAAASGCLFVSMDTGNIHSFGRNP